MRWGTPGEVEVPGHRACYDLDHYLKAARRLRATYNATHLHVSTDSDQVIEKLKASASDFTLSYVPFNRTLVGGAPGANMGKGHGEARANYIEARPHDAETAKLIFATALADIAAMREADMLVGTSSVFSRLMFFAMIGRLGHVPPFVWLDAPVGSGVGDPIVGHIADRNVQQLASQRCPGPT